ncbi:vacuolar-sorting protein BRO1-like protein [Tanacetum coccineum]
MAYPISSLHIESALPTLAKPMLSLDANEDAVVGTLKQSLRQLETLGAQRAGLEDMLKDMKRKDDILPKLMTSTGSYEDLFRKEISKYNHICEEISQNLQAQEQAQNREFAGTFNIEDYKAACDKCYKQIEAAVAKYREIKENINEGLKFYVTLQIGMPRMIEDVQRQMSGLSFQDNKNSNTYNYPSPAPPQRTSSQPEPTNIPNQPCPQTPPYYHHQQPSAQAYGHPQPAAPSGYPPYNHPQQQPPQQQQQPPQPYHGGSPYPPQQVNPTRHPHAEVTVVNLPYPAGRDKSMGNHAKVELPSDWCYNKFRGFGTCVVFKRKKPFGLIRYSVKNFDGASLGGCFPYYHREYFEDKPIRINESYMIWLHYTLDTSKWKEANNFVTFYFEENNEDIEVKECGARLVCDGDLEQDVTNLSMLQDLPTLSQHGGAMCLSGVGGEIIWSW